MDQQVASPPYQAHILFSVTELTESLIKRWRELEDRAYENNVYLSPDFVIPALKHLTPKADLVIVAVDEFEGGRPSMIALGIFESKRGNYYCPFPVLCAYQCRHSFLGGALLDGGKPDRAINLLLTSVKRYGNWRAVRFNWRPVSALAEKAFNEGLRENGIRWHQSETHIRAVLVPGESGSGYLNKVLSKRTKKSFARRRRQLEKMGKLEWRFVQDEDQIKSAAENFIRLENSGWKKRNGSSLASRASDKKFFMDAVVGLAARQKVFFTEFRLNGETISSTCNFISGKTGFAFKLGWDERFARQGLGMLSELELVKRAPEVIPGLKFIDSGTLPGSYLEKLWREKRVLASGFYSLHPAAAAYLNMLEVLRKMRENSKNIFLLLLVGGITCLILSSMSP